MADMNYVAALGAAAACGEDDERSARGADKLEKEKIMSLRACLHTGIALVIAASLSLPVARAQPAALGPDEQQRIDDLVIANHILAHENILDAWGHVSIRSAKNPNHFYLSRSLAPALVRAEDIMEYDENSTPTDARGRALYLERFIHGEIYRARPDVQAVIHSHSPAVVPFSMTGVPLRMAFLLGAFLGPVRRCSKSEILPAISATCR